MALRSPSSTPRRDLDSPPADSPPPTSQGYSKGARAHVARKMNEVERMFANLENEGVEIDGKLASIIVDEVARIKAEAARGNITGLKGKGLTMVMFAISTAAFGFFMGAALCEQAIYAGVGRRVIYGKLA